MAATIHQLPGLINSSEGEDWRCQHRHRKSRLSLHDLLWREYFVDPSQWWDYRNSKVGPAHPDFKHKATMESLWIDDWRTPSWVREELTQRGLASGTQAQGREPRTKTETVIHGTTYDEGTAFVALLKACAKNRDLNRGSKAHDDILKKGLLEKCADALVTMYARCGALAKAKELLDMHMSRDVIAWTALIAGYVRQGQGHNALHCFEQMKREGPPPNAVTFACILKACGITKAVDKGEQIHDEISRQGLLRNDIVLGSSLVDMYVKCGALAKAQEVLEELPSRDVVTWSALIAGYAQQGQGEQALNCFERMQGEGLTPDAATFACTLKACGSIKAYEKGEQIHDEICRQGLLGNNIVLGTALVDMYAKCGALAKAQRVLEELPSRDVVAWNALIAGYAQYGQGEQAVNCFDMMQHEGLSPDTVTLTCVLSACGSLKADEMGEKIHEELARRGLLENNVVLGTALVDMYVKCGSLAKAQRVFEELPSRNVISWSALIGGYAQHGQGEQALDCLKQMQREGLSPNAVTFAYSLKACGTTGATDKGEEIHEEIARQGLLRNDVVLGNALVDMYAKCGALAKAQQVLEELPSRDVVSWSALIAGYSQQGKGEQALNCFERMQHEGLSPNAVTLSCVLNVCSQLGLVEVGHMHFLNMSTKYGIKPDLENYTCMVDLFGRAGQLDRAVGVIEEMPSSNYFAVWSSLLGACWKWGDVKVGRWAFEQAVRVDKRDAAAYVLMGNIYAAAGMKEDAENIGTMRMENIYAAAGMKEDAENIGTMEEN